MKFKTIAWTALPIIFFVAVFCVAFYLGFLRGSYRLPDQFNFVFPVQKSAPKPEEAEPVITGVNPASGKVGTKISITGKNLRGFEGDLNAWIVDSSGEEGILYGERLEGSDLIKTEIPEKACKADVSYSGAECPEWLEIVPGNYKIYTQPWSKESNKIDFTVVK